MDEEDEEDGYEDDNYDAYVIRRLDSIYHI